MALKDIDISKIKEAGAIRYEILNHHRKGKMNVLHIIGLPGTGKSWACLRLAELLSEDLHGKNEITSRNVVDSLLGLLKFIRSVKKEGEIVVCEEIGVWLSSRRAMTAENVDAGYVWDTLRKKRIIVLCNNPISKDVDKKLIALSSMQIQTLALNKKLGMCLLKPLRLQTNPDTAKTYRHRLHYKGFEIHRCWIGKPSKKLTNDYEKAKDTFMNELYYRLEKKHELKKEKEIVSLSNHLQLPTKLEIERYDLTQKGLTHQQIGDMKGVSRVRITNAVNAYKRKMAILQKPKSS